MIFESALHDKKNGEFDPRIPEFLSACMTRESEDLAAYTEEIKAWGMVRIPHEETPKQQQRA
jgi:hypothetical protein